jgi:NDP-sugar pyrophosphorylase family protein
LKIEILANNIDIMNIIIPMGRKGEHFAKEGYMKPKALIDVFEKTMIETVIDNLDQRRFQMGRH